MGNSRRGAAGLFSLLVDFTNEASYRPFDERTDRFIKISLVDFIDLSVS